MKMRFIIIAVIVALSCLCPQQAFAQITKAGRSEITVGWGDQAFETLVWHQKYYPNNISESTTIEYQDNYRYTQHWFLSYQYNLKNWLSLGATADFSGVLWDEVVQTGSTITSRSKNHNFYNISFIPEVKFTYFNKEYVSMYSGLGIGLNVNTGTEDSLKGNKTEFCPGISYTLYGVKAGYHNFFGKVEIGGLVAKGSMDMVYLMCSRMLSIGVGYSF